MSVINYFNDQYSKYRIEAVNIIKKELQKQKREHHNFIYASNTIIYYFNNKVNEFIPTGNEQMTELYKVYKKRGEIYDDENLKLILDNEVFTKYKELNPVFSYKHFIDVLAKRESYYKTSNNFNNHKQVYEMMYQHNRFDGYENMEKFDIIKPGQNDEPIYRELRNILYEDNHPKKSSEFRNVYAKNFVIQKEYYDIIKSKNFYKYLIENDILDEKKNTYDKFYAFFNKEFNKQPQLYFECYNYSVAYLFYSFQKLIFQYLNLKWLFKKGLVLSKSGSKISSNSIRQSYKFIKERDFQSEHIQNSKDAIQYLIDASKKK